MSMPDFAELNTLTADIPAPFALCDLSAFDTNAAIMRRQAEGKPIRVASKSLRNRTLLRRALSQPGFEGVMAFTLPEALWLAEEFDDVLVAYPSTDRASLRELAGSGLFDRITLTVDSDEHLDYLQRTVRPTAAEPLRLCVDLDMSLRLFGGRVHLGPLRSPVHTPDQALSLARQIEKRPGMELVGLLAYEGQIAGVTDRVPGQAMNNAAVRAVKWLSGRELRERRAAIVERVSEFSTVEFVNGGGTGSLGFTAASSGVTELTAGSGFYGPGLFDGYRSIRPLNALHFAFDLVRRPRSGAVTALGGGWIASGAPGKDRLPHLIHPAGLRYTGMEGAGEVQTPLVGKGADSVALGSRVWTRHAKAGEPAERLNAFQLFDGRAMAGEAPTYRGEGKAFL
ncbi:alanine racemase [Salininema proteolyticum]|uniref:Alanine racemase n=1 Tax=Salininema proteolyticum TaxID=1607685 RepID=A0ABV8U1H4_9ACTN